MLSDDEVSNCCISMKYFFQWPVSSLCRVKMRRIRILYAVLTHMLCLTAASQASRTRALIHPKTLNTEFHSKIFRVHLIRYACRRVRIVEGNLMISVTDFFQQFHRCFNSSAHISSVLNVAVEQCAFSIFKHWFFNCIPLICRAVFCLQFLLCFINYYKG